MLYLDRKDEGKMQLQIITDSGCDLPVSLCQQLGVECIPTMIHIEENDFLEDETISREEFFEVLGKGKEVHVYAPSESIFYMRLKQWAAAGKEVLYIGMDRSLYQGIDQALVSKKEVLREFPDFKMTIVDSKSLSLGLGMLVISAARLQQAGADLATILEMLKKGISQSGQYCLLGNLDTLYKRGHIPLGTYMSGKALRICPVLSLTKKGEIKAIHKAKGYEQGIEALVELVSTRLEKEKIDTIGILHIGSQVEASLLEAKLKALGIEEIRISQGGALLGYHLGEKVLGISF